MAYSSIFSEVFHNGIITYFEIHKYFTNNKIEVEDRNVLLRVIKVEDEKVVLILKIEDKQTYHSKITQILTNLWEVLQRVKEPEFKNEKQ